QLREALEQLTEKLKPKSKSGLKNFTRAVIWPFDKDYCEEILSKIERAKSRISLAVQRDISTLGQAIKADTARLPLIDERVSTIAHHADIQQISEEASVVIDFLRKPPVKHDSIGVVAIYCNFNERDQQKPENLLAACCVQLIQPSRNSLREVLTDMYRKHDFGKTKPVWEDVVRVFEDSTKDLHTIYIVVDALDECSDDTRQILLNYFRVLPANTRLLVTTRHIDEITREFIDSPKVEIRADPCDLKKYVASRIAGNRRLEGYVRDASSLKALIYDKVIAKADGMFLAAKLHMDALSTKTNISKLKKALENLSSDLNVLYDDALLRIESQNQDDWELAEKAFRWVAYTHRPLEVRALQEALAIDPDETDLDEEAITPIGLILDVCAGLLILDKENGTVRLMHYTAQDYFDTVQSTRFNNVHASIACDCVTYLGYDCFQHPKNPSGRGTEGSAKGWSDSEASSDSRESNDSEDSSGDTLTPFTRFFWYASEFWAQHAKMANRDAQLSTKIHQFLIGNPRVILEELRDLDDYDRQNMPTDWLEPRQSLEIATFFGLCDELEKIHKDTGEVDALTDDLNLLHLAAHNDQSAAIEVMLDHGADIERRDSCGLTPLLRAIRFEALEAATALIDRGADVMAEATISTDSMYHDYLTPIGTIGSVQGYGTLQSQFLELLLEAGAKIQTRDIFGNTQLMRDLIATDDVQTAEKLFEQHSVEQPKEKKINSTALIFASRYGTTKMVDMLLRYGADINSDGGDNETALHFALKTGSIDRLNHLLACGADVNRQDYSGETAPHIASKKGNLAGMVVLLAYGANMEVPSYDGKTALIFAVEKGNEDCVLTLLRNGANANAQDDHGFTALHLASFAGCLKITHELCKHHATTGTRSKPVITIKYHRSSQHSLQLQHTLFPSPLYTRDDREFQHTALRAYSLEHLSELRHLLSIRKILLDIRVWTEGVTALDFAVFCQHDEIVRLLESSAQSVTKSDSVAFEEYLFDLLGVSSAEEAKEESKRIIQEEKRELSRKFKEEGEWEFRIAEVIDTFEDEEEREENDSPEE
ncbi:MAG: hypothetical protein Q9204_004740, partial [Flavoplaca sp. TL-2023a]